MRAFRLTAEMESAGFSGGSIKYNMQGDMLDIHQALEDGGGMIATDDSTLAESLRGYPALEEVPYDEVPDNLTAVAINVPDFLRPDATAPWQAQTNDVAPGASPEALAAAAKQAADTLRAASGEAGESGTEGDQSPPDDSGEAADHGDEPRDVEEALAAGESVSGLKPRTF